MEEECFDSLKKSTAFQLTVTPDLSAIPKLLSDDPQITQSKLQEKQQRERQRQHPSTSRSSMSLLREEFQNSQQDFEEVSDDETTTSGELETFEISSSNSMQICSDGTSSQQVVDVGVVDDGSSTDTIKLIGVSEPTVPSSQEFFNCIVIQDDDDEEEDHVDTVELDDDDDVVTGVHSGDDDIAIDDDDAEMGNESNDITTHISVGGVALNSMADARTLENGVIVTKSGNTIYLETPIIEEQSGHHQQIINFAGDADHIEKAGKPKCLSNEFLLATQAAVEGVADDLDVDISSEMGTSTATIINSKSSSSSSAPSTINDCVDQNADKMSFRLKKMNINNTAANDCGVDGNVAKISSSSRDLDALPTMPIADIQSMDLIERRDFETEQRLTGGIVIKSSTFENKNMLNLSLIKPCSQAQKQSQEDEEPNNGSGPSSSSSGRAVSSDSKCVYKNSASTPTSSRAGYNSRLSKSTAKLNLCSTLSHTKSQQQRTTFALDINKKMETPKTDKNSSSSSTASASNNAGNVKSSHFSSKLTSSVIVEAPTTSSNIVNAPNENVGAEIFSNSNSNDSLLGGNSSSSSAARTKIASSVKAMRRNLQQEHEESSSRHERGGGCSRTNGATIHSLSAVEHNNATTENTAAGSLFDDTQPSTSSARCQYAPPPKSQRQVHASAQTNERYLLSRGGNTGSSASTSYKSAMAEATTGTTGERDDFLEEAWADCEENNSEVEEICTCQESSSGSSHGGSNVSLNETEEQDASPSDETVLTFIDCATSISSNFIAGNVQQRKRKYNETRLLDSDHNGSLCNAVGSGLGIGCVGAIEEINNSNYRKRIACDYTSTPRSSQSTNVMMLATATAMSPSALTVASSQLIFAASSPIGRRTPRSVIPTRENPPPELQNWLAQFQRWSHAERLLALDCIIEFSEPQQVRYIMKVIEPQFQRDFISLLPRELALQVLAYLDPKDLLQAAQTCRSWRYLCDDNLLWKEKCRKAQILAEPSTDRPKRGRAGNMPHITSPWKAAYMRQHIIEMNWRSRPVREPKVLKGHDDHVITCLQFCGNRIVSGSDDNTLKVWSAVTGRCLRTLVGHTGGVWSSQMSGNIIISGSTDRTLKVWDMDTGNCVHTLLGHTSTVRCMHLHGNKVVSGSRDATLRVWDIDQGTCLHILVGHLAAVRCVQYDGRLIVSGAYDYMVKIWHPERQECLHTLQGHTNRVYSLQFDGLHVVSGSLDTSIRVWDVETGNCKHTLMGHQSLTSGMELRQNILVSGNADSTVKVWDITTGQCLQTLSGPNKHQSAVTCLQFNSRFVVTSSDDGTVKLWDVKTGEFIRNLVALASGGSGGVVWRIRANDTKLICAVGSRNGTEETKLMVLDFDVEGACVKCS